ncbi:MAG: DASS family sodium-coupled anion symporter [Xanthomonadales bacterium]|jgi:sodium-dependent dicarboxylate transporter 2/3/5|nr:DASS family sodium-coupled anion symporter [Xanthomonadales bacterium]
MARGTGQVLRRILLLIGALAAAIWLWTTLTTGLAPAQRAVAFIFLLAVGLWVTEAIPAFAVGLLIMGYLVYVLGSPWIGEGVQDPSAYLDTWSSPVIWLLMGGFFMAAGLTRTGLDRQIFGAALRLAGTRPDRVLLVVMLTTALASMFLSNTSTAAIMIGAVLPFVHRAGPDEPFSRALLLAIPIAASLGGMGTIIGSAPNAIAAGVADDFGVGPGFLAWMVFGLPVSLALVLGCWRLLLWRYPPVTRHVDADLGELDQPSVPHSRMRRNRWVAGILTAVTIALWITTPLHGLHVSVISLVPIVGLTVSQVVGARDVRALPWDTLMLVAGGLSLGAAVVDTGLAAVIAGKLEVFTRVDSTWVTLVLLGWTTVVLSNFMSNTATVSLMLPVAVALVPGRELEMCLVLGLSASCALLLPVSTPPNAVAYGTGLLQIRDLRLGGLAAGVLGPPVIATWVMLMTALFRFLA